MSEKSATKLEKLDKYRWKIARDEKRKMRTDGIIYSSPSLIGAVQNDASIDQVANVATLPGIVGSSMAMPDIHWGYGFPIGGVAAFDTGDGIISPGGVGYDINCGVNLTRTGIELKDLKPRLVSLADSLFSGIPCGVGKGGEGHFRNVSPCG